MNPTNEQIALWLDPQRQRAGWWRENYSYHVDNEILSILLSDKPGISLARAIWAALKGGAQ
jgi:hypothetical protein